MSLKFHLQDSMKKDNLEKRSLVESKIFKKVLEPKKSLMELVSLCTKNKSSVFWATTAPVKPPQ